MPKYAFASLESRREIQKLWEDGKTSQEIAVIVGGSVSTIYTELRRGRDGKRLPDMRRRYDAELAQLRMAEELENRGRRKKSDISPKEMTREDFSTI